MIKAIEVNPDGSPGPIAAFPWRGTQVMDLAFGPDGALYVLDYGTNADNVALQDDELRRRLDNPQARG